MDAKSECGVNGACVLRANQIERGYVPLCADTETPNRAIVLGFFMGNRMQLKQIFANAAPVFVLIGLVSMFESSIPGFSVPGATLEWMAAGIAMALVAK